MNNDRYKVGMIVTHPNKPEWGQGEIETVTESSVHIFFRNGPHNKTRMYNRLYPGGPIGWDNSDLDYVRVKPEIEIEADIQYFAKPDKIFSLTDLQEEGLPPRAPGVYGWYFKKRPPFVRVKDCAPKRGRFKKWKLLYIGLGSNLCLRILNMHFAGDADCSSLRLSLGCLLTRKRNLFLWKIPTSKEGEYRYTFGDKGEVDLSKWMADYARVAYRESEYYEELEKRAIERYCPPLNIDHNPRPFTPLKVLRYDIRACATLRGSKPPKEAVKNAYRKFVKKRKEK